MGKKLIWSYDTSNWDKEAIQKEYQQESGVLLEGQMLDDFIELTNSYYFDDEKWNIKYFENTHKEKNYLVYGTLGLWNGTPHVFKVVSGLWTAISSCFEDYNSIWYEEGIVKVSAIHHDGTNDFCIKEISSTGMDLLTEDFANIGEVIKNHTSAVSLYKKMYGF